MARGMAVQMIKSPLLPNCYRFAASGNFHTAWVIYDSVGLVRSAVIRQVGGDAGTLHDVREFPSGSAPPPCDQARELHRIDARGQGRGGEASAPDRITCVPSPTGAFHETDLRGPCRNAGTRRTGCRPPPALSLARRQYRHDRALQPRRRHLGCGASGSSGARTAYTVAVSLNDGFPIDLLVDTGAMGLCIIQQEIDWMLSGVNHFGKPSLFPSDFEVGPSSRRLAGRG